MRAFSLVLPLIVVANAAAAQSVPSDRLHRAISACQREMSDVDRVQCLQAALEVSEPCTGSVEARLACLEGRIAKQAREMVRLRYEIDKLSRPRVQPLDGSYVSER
jgi:hypothetical protein